MGQRIGKEKIQREKGFLYFIGNDGYIWAAPMKHNKTGKKKKVSTEKIAKEEGFMYYIGKDGFVAKAKIKNELKKEETKTPTPNQIVIKETASVEQEPGSSISFDDKPTELLCTIIKNNNPGIINNKDAFRGLLKDYFVGDYSKYKKESSILEKSVIENIPRDLLVKKDQIPFPVLSAQLIQRLDDCAFSNDLSVWAVHAWARALGVKTK